MLQPGQFVRSYVNDQPGVIGVVIEVKYDYLDRAYVATVFWIDNRVAGRFDAHSHRYLGIGGAEARPINVTITEV